MQLHSRFGWVWREPTAPQVGSNDVATARWADGFLEYGCIDPRRKLRCYSASDVAGRMVSRVRGGRPSAEPNRYFASDVPAERRSSHASTTRFAMPASAALPQARGS